MCFVLFCLECMCDIINTLEANPNPILSLHECAENALLEKQWAHSD